MADEFHAIVQMHIRPDGAERADFDVCSQARFGSDDSGGVNFRF
jgi:hypothetical protein